MKQGFVIILFISFIYSYGQESSTYPITPKCNIVDTIWHKPVPDPYRWLENIRSDSTGEWLKSQAIITEKYSGKLASNLIDHLSNYSEIRSHYITKEGKYYFSFYIYNSQKAAVLYYQTRPEDSPEILFDPASIDKTSAISIDGYAISEDDRILALVLSRNGSDWKTIRFLDIEKRTLLDDSLRFVKYSPIYWSGNGVFYIQYDVKDESESFTGLIKIRGLQYHKLGTKQQDDPILFNTDNDKANFLFEVTQGKRYLILSVRKKENGKIKRILSYRSLPLKVDDTFKDFIVSDLKDIYFNIIGELNDKLLVASNLRAKNGVVYKCDPYKVNSFDMLIPHYKERLQSARIVNDNRVVTLYNGDKRSYGAINDSTGKKLKSWTIPEGFSFSGLSYSPGDNTLLYYFNSFFNPSSVYMIDLNTLEQKALTKTEVPFSFKDLTTEMVYYYSKDSTLIPMYLTHKKNIKLDGKNPTILFGYGGFGINTEPFFDVNNIAFLNSGGLFAAPQLRGGDDYPGWHEQGMRLNKQNTFDDFICAAEYLIREKYTNSSVLAALGGSNGGLLVGACMTQRPDLFRVVVSRSGVLDMLRYHMFNVGYVYKEEYGNIEDSADFENLMKYSPVQNVKSGVDYPATLLVASDNDDRVNPFHSFKFLSQLQANGSGKNPYVLYYVEKGGHSGSRIFDERMKANAYVYAFIYKYLGMEKKVFFED